MKLMTAEEFANKYQIHPKTAYRLAREGKVDVVRVGRSVRFKDEESEVRNDKREIE